MRRETRHPKLAKVQIVRTVSGCWTALDLLESLPGAAAGLDPTLHVRLANRPFAARFGLQPPDVLGRAVADLGTTEGARLAELARRVFESRRPWRTYAAALLPSDGHEPGDEDVIVVPIGLEPAAPMGVLVFCVDARDRLRLERALRLRDQRVERLAEEQIARLRQLDKLKSDFLSAASHELRTPLAAIMGYAELLADGVVGPLAPRQQQFAGEIMHATERLHRLIDDLLDFGQLESGALVVAAAEVDACALALDAANLARQVASDLGLTIELDVPAAPVRVHGDGRRLARALAHLIDNAIKFTNRGGRVTVRVVSDPGATRIEVEDTGIGVPKSHQLQIFEKFYQVDSGSTRRAGGTGIGLSLVRAIAEAHGGQVGLVSEPGRGSRFWVSLPAFA